MDEKKEDKSEKSLREHLIFYRKLNNKINDMQNEIQISNDPKILEHLNERIKAIELDKTRIRKLFPNVNKKTWIG